ncbi:hypothetical protein DYU11_20075 [Fibrisoma montanum]|uniref:Uncharacterized protein n=1 Tax=Fibrisoma montanum TaxID=2305895 RepID=A0A418M3N5_9BACT|nr:hypothetical protein [Fibrisoma montanum]RIV20351.1 hypothetical protein DYU11_20075 [Fibrisoma montanum]
METKTWTYTVSVDDPAPKPGEYIVTVGKRGINSVLLIRKVRKVNHKRVSEDQGYVVEVMYRPDLKPLADIEWHSAEDLSVWVKGEPAWPLFWNPR